MSEMDNGAGGAQPDEDRSVPSGPQSGEGQTDGQSQATVPEEDDPAIKETEQQPT